jgi:hypothetical protein
MRLPVAFIRLLGKTGTNRNAIAINPATIACVVFEYTIL